MTLPSHLSEYSNSRRASQKLKFALVMASLLSGLMAMTCLSVLAAQPDLEEIIQDKVSQRHPSDTPAWWQSLGPDAPKAIIDLYDKAGGIYERTRLLGGLSNFHDPDSVAFLKKQAENSQQDVIRNSAIQAVGSAGGSADVEFLGKFLDNEDPQTRVAAGKALRKINDPKGNALLQKFYSKESLPWVKDRVQEFSPVKLGSGGPLLRIASKTPVTLKAEWTGSWKGILIVPSKQASVQSSGQGSGLIRLDAQASTQIENSTTLKGELSFQLPPLTASPGSTPRSVTVQFSQVSGRDTHVSGWLKSDVLKVWGAKEGSVHFDGELIERGDVRLFKVESRELMLTVILRST